LQAHAPAAPRAPAKPKRDEAAVKRARQRAGRAEERLGKAEQERDEARKRLVAAEDALARAAEAATEARLAPEGAERGEGTGGRGGGGRGGGGPAWPALPRVRSGVHVDLERDEPACGDAAEEILARLAGADEDDEQLLTRRGREEPQPVRRQRRPAVCTGGDL